VRLLTSVLAGALLLALAAFFVFQGAAAIAMLSVIGSLLRTSLWGWTAAEGWLRYYWLAGALTTLALLVRIGIPAVTVLLRDSWRDPMRIIAIVLVFGCIPVLLIPFATVGWPLVLWIAYGSHVRRNAMPLPPSNEELKPAR
jgi:hypothetical protein